MPKKYEDDDLEQRPGWRMDPVTELLTEVRALKEQCKHFVTDKEFEPIRRFVYGVSSLILIAVLAALISRVVSK